MEYGTVLVLNFMNKMYSIDFKLSDNINPCNNINNVGVQDFFNMKKKMKNIDADKKKESEYYFISAFVSDSEHITPHSSIIGLGRIGTYSKDVINQYVRNIEFNKIDIYKNNVSFLPVPIYNQPDRFFILWELMNHYDFKELLSNPNKLDICYIACPLFYDSVIDNKYIPPTDIILCITELRKKFTKMKQFDLHYIYMIILKQLEVNNDFLNNMNINYILKKSESNGEMHFDLNRIHDIIICFCTHGTLGKFYDDNSKIYYYNNEIYKKYFLRYVCYTLITLKIGKDAIFYIKTGYTCFDSYQEIFVILQCHFEKVIFHYPMCTGNKSYQLCIICHNLLIKNNDELKNLLDKTYQISIGKPNIYNISDYQESIRDNKFISRILSSTSVNNKITNIFEIISETLLGVIDMVLEIMNLFYVWDKSSEKTYIKTKIDEQVKFAIEWCNKYDMKIHPFYKGQEENLQYINKVINYAKFFPKKNGIDTSKLLMTNIGLSNIIDYHQTINIVEIIKKYINMPINKLIITESNGGVGESVIIFSDYFKLVNVVEYLPIHCDVLRNNVIKVYKCSNVVLFCTDYSLVFKRIKQDVLYISPLERPNDKYVDKLYLHIGNYMIEEIINEIKNDTKIIVIRAPFNYDIDYLKKTVDGRIFIHNFVNFQIIIIIFGNL